MMNAANRLGPPPTLLLLVRPILLAVLALSLALPPAPVAGGGTNGATARRSRTDAAPPAFILRQHLDGIIGKIDPKAGVAVVSTRAGKLQLVSPRLASTSLSKGDPVLVELSILGVPASSVAKVSPPPDGHDPAFSRQRVVGLVRDLNAGRGQMKVQTALGPLEMTVPESITEHLGVGDTVAMEVALLPPAPDDHRAARAGLAGLLLGLFGKK